MRICALITFRALFAFGYELTHIIAVKISISFSVLGVVVVYTVLMEMLLGIRAWV